MVGALIGFLLLAIAFAITVTRTLESEIQRLLQAARAIGRGDFSQRVPAEGNDEFAALGNEFNSMAVQLEERLEELQRERARLQDAIRRVGESFTKSLDRVGLLEIVVQTAVDGIEAACGRATIRRAGEDRLQEVAATGDARAYERVLHAAEAAALDAGQIAEIELGRRQRAGRTARRRRRHAAGGIVSVARGDRRFTAGERELFSYLTNQAAVSVENVDLHETVQRQAVTDELTGLFNHRRFQEVITQEVERARRYNQEIGLIMLDIDNFKRVNDTYGHLQGDMVLREVARVLRQSSREIDEPARYGGEEMAVALPQTDLEGAFQFAERVRRRIEALDLPLLDGDGMLKVTASFGAASLNTPPATARTRSSRLPTPPCTVRSGRGRTVRSGPSNLHGEAWDCSTTQFESTWSSSAGTGPIPRRSRGRSARPSGTAPACRVRTAGGRGRSGRVARGRGAAEEAVEDAPESPARSRRRRSPAPAGSEAPESRTRWLVEDPPPGAGAHRRGPGQEESPRRRPRRVVRPDEEEPADELEETPEFLQETPEHERLWFEQKPPRDFDWDK